MTETVLIQLQHPLLIEFRILVIVICLLFVIWCLEFIQFMPSAILSYPL